MKGDDAEDDIFGERFRTAKLRDLKSGIEVNNQIQGYRCGVRDDKVCGYSRAAEPRRHKCQQIDKSATYLWVSLDNSLSPCPVRFLRISPEEVVFHRGGLWSWDSGGRGFCGRRRRLSRRHPEVRRGSFYDRRHVGGE